MTAQTHTRLATAPALLVFKDSPERAGKRGVILFYHGFGVAKEVQLKELHSLAEHGFLAVGVDNVGHGERRHVDFEERYSGEHDVWFGKFLDDVRATAAEIPSLCDELLQRDLARPEGLGVAGISMGGYIAYAAKLYEPRLRTITPVLASPRWGKGDADSPHLHADRFFSTALLVQNAGADENVPPRFAREFHQQLSLYYETAPERLKYVEFPDVGHFMPEPDWDRLWANLIDWHLRFLG